MSLNRKLLLLVIMLSAVKSEDLDNDNEEENIDTDTKNDAAKLSPVMRFTYGDNDPFGKCGQLNYICLSCLVS